MEVRLSVVPLQLASAKVSEIELSNSVGHIVDVDVTGMHSVAYADHGFFTVCAIHVT